MTDETKDGLVSKGIYRSSAKVIQNLVDRIEAELLTPNETLNNLPSSFSNIMLDRIGKHSALSFYEQQMYKNELQPSTAIKLRSLINKLNSDTLSEIYAFPAQMVFGLGYDFEELISKGVAETDTVGHPTGNKIFRLNKGFTIHVLGQPSFTLDHDVIITVTKNVFIDKSGTEILQNNIFAKFDISDKNSEISAVSNPFITSQTVVYENRKIFIMFLPMRQYERSEKYSEVILKDTEIEVDFENQLFAFELFYKDNSSTDNKFRKLIGKHDGIVNPGGYNFSLDIIPERGIQKIRFSFNSVNGFVPNIGDNIKTVIYTTKGKAGNFKLPNIYENYKGLSYQYKQNRANKDEEALLDIKPWLTLKENVSSNGRDMKSFSEIKEMVIRRGSNSTVLTPGQLEKKAEEYGFVTKKVRDDIRCLEFRASNVLRNEYGGILSSSMRDIGFIFDTESLTLHKSGSTFLNPSDVFTYDSITGMFEYNEKETNDFNKYNEYKEKYGRTLTKPHLCLPFTVKINTSDTFKTNVYNLNIDMMRYSTNFEWFNAYSPHEISILNMFLSRNVLETKFTPEIEKIRELNDKPHSGFCFPLCMMKRVDSDGTDNLQKVTGFYYIDFDVFLNDVVIQMLHNHYAENVTLGTTYKPNNINETIVKESPIKFRLRITNKIRHVSYYTDAYPIKLDVANNVASLRCYLPVNGVIDDMDNVEVVNYSLTPITGTANVVNSYTLESDIDVEIITLLKDKTNSEYIVENMPPEAKKYNSVLSLDEKDKNTGVYNYFIAAVYSVKNVKLYEDLSDKVFINADFKLMDVSANRASTKWDEIIYDKIIYDTYEEDVYERHIKPSIITYDADIYGTPPVDPSTGIPNIEHFAGDAILDSVTGNIQIEPGKNVGDFVLDNSGEKIVKFRKHEIKHKVIPGKEEKLPIKYKFTASGKKVVKDYITFKAGDTYSDEKVVKECDAACYRYKRNPDGSFELDNFNNKIIEEVEYIMKGSPEYEKIVKEAQTGNIPVVTDKPKVKCILKQVSLYNRIYQDVEPFKSVLKAFVTLFNKLGGLKSYTPDGVQMVLGIRNTTGSGAYEIYNMKKNVWEPIDDISLSLALGVKFKENYILDAKEVSKKIKKDVVDYIENLEDVSFSITELFQYLKDKNREILHMVLYKINNYQPDVVQTIRKKDNSKYIEDVLCIKQIYSGLTVDKEIIFEPDIDIRII